MRDLVNQSLDVVDVSTWTGDPLNASFIFGQLRLLHETITEARHMLKGENNNVQGKWWETSVEDNVSHSTLHAPGSASGLIGLQDFRPSTTTRSLVPPLYCGLGSCAPFENA